MPAHCGRKTFHFQDEKAAMSGSVKTARNTPGQQRREHAKQMRLEQERRERRSRRLFWIGAVVVLVIAGAVIAIAATLGGSSKAPVAAGPIADLKTYSGLARDHTAAPVTYAQTPPVGGAHSAIWQNAGWYDKPVRNENAVHTLEHAAVWVTYSPSLSNGDKALLKAALAGKPYVLASPYAGLPGPVVASAWGKQVVLNGVSDPRLQQFIAAFANAPTAPEPGGEVTGGTSATK
jgi:hypothetical protein